MDETLCISALTCALLFCGVTGYVKNDYTAETSAKLFTKILVLKRARWEVSRKQCFQLRKLP